MKIRKLCILALVMLFGLSASAHAGVETVLGKKSESTNEYRAVIEDGVLTFASDLAIKVPYQSGTTTDTLTAADSGRLYVISSATVSAVTLNLPAAAVGMTFPVINSSTDSVYLNPNGTDTINYASLSAGDSIYNSSTAKGDAITLYCTTANTWDVMIHNGTWADGN